MQLSKQRADLPGQCFRFFGNDSALPTSALSNLSSVTLHIYFIVLLAFDLILIINIAKK